jgi:hypothetical protein
MEQLTDPILHDCARIVERHPDLSPAYKTRLLAGIAAIDRDLRERVRAETAPTTAKVKR